MFKEDETASTGNLYTPVSLLELCSKQVAGWIDEEQVRQIPVDLYEPLQRWMAKDKQKQLFGEVRRWYENGKLKSVEPWKDGQKHGTCKGFDV